MVATPKHLSVETLTECLGQSGKGEISFKPAPLKAFFKDALALASGEELFKILAMVLQFSILLKAQSGGEAALKSLQKEVPALVKRLEALAKQDGAKSESRIKEAKKMAAALDESAATKGAKKGLKPATGGVGLRKQKPKR